MLDSSLHTLLHEVVFAPGVGKGRGRKAKLWRIDAQLQHQQVGCTAFWLKVVFGVVRPGPTITTTATVTCPLSCTPHHQPITGVPFQHLFDGDAAGL